MEANPLKDADRIVQQFSNSIPKQIEYMYPVGSVQLDLPLTQLPQHTSVDPVSNVYQYIDRDRFPVQYMDETGRASQFETLVKEADHFINKMYAHRSLVSTISQALKIKKPETEGLEEEFRQFKQIQVDILTPLREFYKQFYQFGSSYVQQLRKHIEDFTHMNPSQDFCTDTLLYSFVKALDKLIILDEVKTRKTAPSNEISFFSMVDKTVNQQEITDIKMFFVTPNILVKRLHTDLINTAGSYLFLVQMCNFCVATFKANLHLSMTDKHMLIRVMGLGLYLIDECRKISDKQRKELYKGKEVKVDPPLSKDQKGKQGFSVYKKGNLEIDQIKEILLQYPVVPLFFEITFYPMKYLKQTEPFLSPFPSDWKENTEAVAQRISIRDHVPELETKVNSIISMLTFQKLHLRRFVFNLSKDPSADNKRKTEEARENVVKTIIEALKLLSSIRTLLLEFIATKYETAADLKRYERIYDQEKKALSDFDSGVQQSEENPEENTTSEPAAAQSHAAKAAQKAKEIQDRFEKESSFEKFLRYNLDFQERTALVNLIVIIQTFKQYVDEQCTSLQNEINQYIYYRVQYFCQVTCRQLLQHCAKAKKSDTLLFLLKLREDAARWTSGQTPTGDYTILEKPPKSSSDFKMPPITPSPTPPHPTQLFILRSIVSSLCSTRSPAFNKPEKTVHIIEKDDLQLLHQFEAESFYFPYLMDTKSTIAQITDLGQLWYREDFIERGRSTEQVQQYPIDSSLPYILINHLVTSMPQSIDKFLMLFDLYGQSARIALVQLKNQCLYDELIGEARLAMNIQAFQLGNATYNHFKYIETVKYMNGEFRVKRDSYIAHDTQKLNKKQPGYSTFTPPILPYDKLFRQRIVDVVGFRMDFGGLIAKHVENHLIEDLAVIVSCFRSAYRVEPSAAAFMIIRNLHLELSLIMPMINSWDVILDSFVNAGTTVSFSSGLATNLSKMLTDDLAANYSFSLTNNSFSPKRRPDGSIKYNDPFSTRAAIQQVFPVSLKRELQAFFTTRHVFFLSDVHLTPFTSILNSGQLNVAYLSICDTLTKLINTISYHAKQFSQGLDFTGREVIDELLFVGKEDMGKLMEKVKQKQLTVLKNLEHESLVTDIALLGNIVASLMQLDSAIANSSGEKFVSNSSAIWYGLRTAYNQTNQLPQYTTTTSPIPRPGESTPPTQSLNPAELAATALVTPHTALTAAATSTDLIRTRPLLTGALSHLVNVCRSLNDPFLAPHSSSSFVCTDDFGHSVRLFEILSILLTTSLTPDFPERVQQYGNLPPPTFWLNNGDGFLIGIQTLVHITGQTIPFETVSLPSYYTTFNNWKTEKYSQEPFVKNTSHALNVFSTMKGILSESVPLEPVSKHPITRVATATSIDASSLIKTSQYNATIPNPNDTAFFYQTKLAPPQTQGSAQGQQLTQSQAQLTPATPQPTPQSSPASSVPAAPSAGSVPPPPAADASVPPPPPVGGSVPPPPAADASVPPPPPVGGSVPPPPAASASVPPPPPMGGSVPPPPAASASIPPPPPVGASIPPPPAVDAAPPPPPMGESVPPPPPAEASIPPPPAAAIPPPPPDNLDMPPPPPMDEIDDIPPPPADMDMPPSPPADLDDVPPPPFDDAPPPPPMDDLPPPPPF
ncbi:putative Cytoplasmic FMR1-interacting protein 1 like protein [Blattamonas nauphoetae]|uniref:Cytoplasmic FMR1-interacting protein 1 like protein n=1 Tax=Blattamonas nauphoetae TaxID=2049346 RepID=A0ABQ9YKZ8_9EUKA|nr:putative Cytoplasmic FMR1-interacting protein 1 like protein [Blattamonas nauphoetae]